MSSLPARMKTIQSKMKELERYNIFPIISLWGFSRRSMAANSAVLSLIWPNFELVRDVMVVLITTLGANFYILFCSVAFLHISIIQYQVKSGK